MDREAQQATVHRVQRAGHNWAQMTQGWSLELETGYLGPCYFDFRHLADCVQTVNFHLMTSFYTPPPNDMVHIVSWVRVPAEQSKEGISEKGWTLNSGFWCI